MQEVYPEGQGWNRRARIALLTVVLLFPQLSCGGNGSDTRREISNEDLAYHWAPVHDQDIHLTYLTEETFSRFEAKRLRPFPLEWSSQQDRMSMGDVLPRVVTTQEQGGHGAGCYPDWGAPSPGNLLVWPRYKDRPHDGGGDHIRYIPGTVAEEPDYNDIYYDDEGNEKQDPNRFTYCRYKLINLFSPDGGLWYHRDEPRVFTDTRRTFIGHSTPQWCWRGDKGTNEGEFVLDGFSLAPEEKAWVVASQHPWTHNPAHPCWAYLRLTDGTDPQAYFSAEYEWNPYLEDFLDGT